MVPTIAVVVHHIVPNRREVLWRLHLRVRLLEFLKLLLVFGKIAPFAKAFPSELLAAQNGLAVP